MIALLINNQPLGDEYRLQANDFAEWTPLEIACVPLPDVATISLQLGGEQLGLPTTSPFDPTWRWHWLPRGVAGDVRGELCATFTNGTTQARSFVLRLQPRLLDAQTWTALLTDLTRLARNLAVALGGAAFAHATLVPLRPDDRTALEEALALLERHSLDLEQALRDLSANPDSTLQPAAQRQPLGQVRAPDPAALTLPHADFDLETQYAETPRIRQLRARFGGALPRSLPVDVSRDSADLPEHRWIVGLVTTVERRLRTVRSLIEEAAAPQPGEQIRSALADLTARTENALGRLRRLRQSAPLIGLPARATPPPQSQRLVRDRRYRPFRRIWRELRDTPLLTLEAPVLALPISDLPTLYEQWCALVVAEIVIAGGVIITQQLLVEDAARERWTMHLSTTTPLLELQVGPQIWRLRYQPRYSARPDALGIVALDGYTRIPDLVLEIITPNSAPTVVVLDAKYRRAPNQRVPQDALDDAYAYRGSLGRDQVSAVRYAAILYPHHGTAEDFGSVGAVPLLPAHTTELHNLIQNLMRYNNSR